MLYDNTAKVFNNDYSLLFHNKLGSRLNMLIARKNKFLAFVTFFVSQMRNIGTRTLFYDLNKLTSIANNFCKQHANKS